MNPRSPVVTLSSVEGAKLRTMLRSMGVDAARRELGNIEAQTLYKAASEVPVSRLTAEYIRGRLDRI